MRPQLGCAAVHCLVSGEMHLQCQVCASQSCVLDSVILSHVHVHMWKCTVLLSCHVNTLHLRWTAACCNTLLAVEWLLPCHSVHRVDKAVTGLL